MSQNPPPPPQDQPNRPSPQPQGPPPGYGPQPGPPPSAPPYQPPQYAPGQYGYQGGPTREHPQATLAFVLGLLSVIGITILGPFGWYYGRKVVREIDADPRGYTNRGLAMAGMILGIIGTVILALVVLFVVFAVIAAVLSSGSRVR